MRWLTVLFLLLPAFSYADSMRYRSIDIQKLEGYSCTEEEGIVVLRYFPYPSSFVLVRDENGTSHKMGYLDLLEKTFGHEVTDSDYAHDLYLYYCGKDKGGRLNIGGYYIDPQDSVYISYIPPEDVQKNAHRPYFQVYSLAGFFMEEFRFHELREDILSFEGLKLKKGGLVEIYSETCAYEGSAATCKFLYRERNTYDWGCFRVDGFAYEGWATFMDKSYELLPYYAGHSYCRVEFLEDTVMYDYDGNFEEFIFFEKGTEDYVSCYESSCMYSNPHTCGEIYKFPLYNGKSKVLKLIEGREVAVSC